MHRRLFITGTVAGLAAIVAGRAGLAASETTAVKGDFPPIEKSAREWRELLTESQFKVLFEEATERPWTSPLNAEKRAGIYVCAACFLPLFHSDTKFDSGTGWPSFFRAIEGNVGTKVDYKILFPRTEYHCARCGGHQGHVFDDGPEPTGQRWCNNGVALRFVPAAEELPALRT